MTEKEDNREDWEGATFHCRASQKNISFQVCKEKYKVRNITIRHEFGGSDLLNGTYSLEELSSPLMNRADIATAISRRLNLERAKLPNQGQKIRLPW